MSDYKEPSETFSQNNKIILGAIIFLLVLTIGYKFFSKPNIKLVFPNNNQSLGADELSFQWQCNKSKVSYVIEVYDEGELVLRQITDQQIYKLDQYQQSFFKKDHKYYWYVLSNPDIVQPYVFKSELMYFQITKTVPMPEQPVSSPPQDQEPTPKPVGPIKHIPD